MPLTDRQRDTIVRTVLGEAANQSREGQAAVAWVIKNRAQSGQFGTNDPAQIARQPWQFSANNPLGQGGNTVGRTARPSSSTYQRAQRIVDAVFNDEVDDPTGGATYYHTANSNPGWDNSMYRTAQIGAHVFYSPSPVPPMAVPDVGAELAYIDAPKPQTLSSALQAIQANTAPSEWSSFYSGILPPANAAPSVSPDDYAQITTPKQAADWYGNFGLPAAGNSPSDYATITTPDQASDFYSGFGLPVAASTDAPQIRTAQDAATFYDGFGLSPASSPQVASGDNSIPPSIPPRAWGAPSSPSAAVELPSLTASNWAGPFYSAPNLASGNVKTGSTQYQNQDGSIFSFEPRSVALPADLPTKDAGVGIPSSLFASTVPASLTAPTLNSDTALGAGPRTADSFSVPSVTSAVSSAWPTLPNSGNFGSYADMSGAFATPQPGAPTYQTVTKYRTVSEQVPIETGDGVTWNPATNNYELSAPQYQTVTKSVPYQVKVPVASSTAVPAASSVAPVFPASPPESELSQLRQQALNPLQRLLNVTPAGHVLNFLDGADAAYGAPQTGGVLQAIARANNANPLATLFGGLLGGQQTQVQPVQMSDALKAVYGITPSNPLGNAYSSAAANNASAAAMTSPGGSLSWGM